MKISIDFNNMSIRISLAVLVSIVAFSPAARAQAPADASKVPTTTRLVVKYKEGTARLADAAAAEVRVKALSARARESLTEVKGTAAGATILKLGKTVSLSEARVLALRIAQDPNVAYAAPDVWVRPMSTPNDPHAARQWVSLPLSESFGSGRFFEAWKFAGKYRAVVAVVDDGQVPHSDLSPNEMAGYDFVSDLGHAGDGSGRDPDPSDVGSYCEAQGTDSDWHGLKTAGLIAAVANNSAGVAGAAANNATVLQVRAMGRCGGWLTDVADAVTWAAGGDVAGVPTNGTPAQVINLSLGSPAGTACFPYIQDAINLANAKRAVVVVSAGNEGANDVGAPANCAGVIAVGSHTRSGDLASYSNRSEAVTLTGPGGGNCQTQQGVACNTDAPMTLGNAGTRSPGGETPMTFYAGTSAAAAHVSAAAAMLRAANGELTPAQIRSVLVSTARPHASDSYCALNKAKCGAGMLDATAALASVIAPTLTLTYPTKQVVGSSKVTLSVAAAGGQAPYTYQWKQTYGPAVTLKNETTASAEFTAPATKGEALVFEVRVTSSNGMSSTEIASVRVNNPAVLTIPSNVNVTAGNSLSHTLSGSDPDGDPVSYSLVQAPTGASVTGGVLTWATPPEGTHNFVIVATDGSQDGTGDSAQFTMMVTVTKATSNGGGGGSSGGVGGASSGGGGGAVPFTGLALLVIVAAGSLAARRRKP